MLPPALVQAAETHGCFSGCYSGDSDVYVVVDPNQPPEYAVQIHCGDCLSFHLVALVRDLPKGVRARRLADEISEHMRTLRGYEWAVGGFHNSPASMWLSAAYYAAGIFLIGGERNKQFNDDVECLIAGFNAGLIKPADPGMLQTSNYRAMTIYVDMSAPILPVGELDDILNSPRCRTSYGPGFRAVTVAEYLPFTQATQPRFSTPVSPANPSPQVAGGTPPAAIPPISLAPTAPTSAPTPPAAKLKPTTPATPPPRPRPLSLGERCTVCGHLVKERPSFVGTFIGCMC